MKFILKFYYLLFKLVATNFTTKIWKYMLALNYFQMSHLPLGKKITTIWLFSILIRRGFWVHIFQMGPNDYLMNGPLFAMTASCQWWMPSGCLGQVHLCACFVLVHGPGWHWNQVRFGGLKQMLLSLLISKFDRVHKSHAKKYYVRPLLV